MRFGSKTNPLRTRPDRRAETARYRAKHQDRISAKSAVYREKNREKLRLASAAVRANEPEKIKARKADYYARNRESCNARKAKWRREHPDYKPNPRSRKNTILKGRFGITIEDYERLLAAQNGVCAICKGKGAKALHVDHCHATDRIRGLLCFRCNGAIGSFKDSIELLSAAVQYLTGGQK